MPEFGTAHGMRAMLLGSERIGHVPDVLHAVWGRFKNLHHGGVPESFGVLPCIYSCNDSLARDAMTYKDHSPFVPRHAMSAVSDAFKSEFKIHEIPLEVFSSWERKVRA
ncbi:hypothetical protein GCM10009861_11560 [Neomicrococcus aestuarii]